MLSISFKSGIVSLFLIQVLFSCATQPSAPPAPPATALYSYINNNDNSFNWEIKDKHITGDLTVYNLLVTSQQWREYSWKHQLTVIVPETNTHDGALLFITGGSNKNEIPNWRNNDDGIIKFMSTVALKNNAVTAVLYQVPNQPLYGNLTEDELISYTLHNYRQDKDLTWPLLFPMVKSAVRSMDAVQAFSAEILEHEINRFVVSGGSKRGWTTWLTGASDQRVEAIAPMVIDMLNMPVSIDYHLTAWGDYSIQIADYVKLGIAQDVNTPDGLELTAMIDPYLISGTSFQCPN
jgi:PhoPQ-activated pathogenicity-related protein